MKLWFKKLLEHNDEELVWNFSIPDRKPAIIWGIFSGFLIAFLNYPFGAFFRKPPMELLDLIDLLQNYPSITPLFLVLLMPFFEELLVRGLVYRKIRNRFNALYGHLISAFLFVAMHEFKHLLLIMCNSFILSFIYEEKKTILAPIVAHILWNLTWLIASLWYVSVDQN